MRKLTRREKRHLLDVCKSASILLFSIVFLLFCIFFKQIIFVVGGFVCVLAFMYIASHI